jgi:hypothetical protein
VTDEQTLPWQELLAAQQGVISLGQAVRGGLPVRKVEARLRTGRWQAMHRGVYAGFTGEPSRLAELWAAVLRAGPGAMLSHHSAAELDRLADRHVSAIHVTVRSDRRVRIPAGARSRIVVHYSARAGGACHPSRTPPRTRIQETVLDLAASAQDLAEARDWLTRACSRRLVTPELLLAAMTARPKLRWRAELTAGLVETDAGVHSALESRYARDVERPHGLPRAQRQALSRASRRSRYLDNLYRDFGVAVELDGRAAHPAEARWRDIHRDNASAAAGIVTLRYNWADVAVRPCQVAAEIGRVLRARGWPGQLRSCRPGCPASRS